MSVVPYRANFKVKIAAALLFFLVVSYVGGYYFGKKGTIQNFNELNAANEQLKKLYKDSDSELKSLKSEIANLRVSSEVDRQAAEKVRLDVRDLDNTISELEEAVAFYKGVMDPAKNARGLSVPSFSLFKTEEINRFRYKLIIVQLTDTNQLIRGNLALNIIGKMSDQQALRIKGLSRELVAEKIELKFKYFQEIVGEIVLPADFIPEQVDVVANSIGKNADTLERKFDWNVQEN